MRISQKLFDLIPNGSIRNKALLKSLYKAGDILGRPMPNRLIMGATALLSQPFIDYNNKKVDKETARTSRNRTIGKILAGTAVGCVVRGGVYALLNRSTNLDISVDRWDNFFTPRSSATASSHMLKNMMLNYKTAFATILALVIMLGTNILVDMPLTNAISNFLNKKGAKGKKTKNNNEVSSVNKMPIQNPADIIKNTFNIQKGGRT